MTELRTLARHAGTVLVGQLAVMAFGVTDTIVAGRYSPEALAALSVGSAVFISVFVALIGVMQVLLPAWAELYGAGRHEDLGQSVRQSLYLFALATVAGFLGLFLSAPLLHWTDVPPAMRGDVQAYLAALALALPATLLFRMYSSLNQALHKPLLVTWLQIAALGLKVPLSIWFCFGGLGLDAHGAVGCAWATVVVNYLLVGGAFWLLRTQPLYAPFALWRRIEPPNWRVIGHHLRLGVPAGLAVMVEVTSFTLMALFIARQGALASAAHQIAANLAAVFFMSPLSIAIATSARVSFWLGAGDARKARHSIRSGFKLALAAALGICVLLGLARHEIAAVYAGNPEVVAVAGGLLGWVALYHVGDAVQGVCVFVLRCYRVAVAPLIAYCVLLWGAGLGGGYLLAYRGIGPFAPMNSPAAFWIMGALALVLLASVLPLILWRAVHAWRPPLPYAAG
ncbi:MATE family efflux transporter [Ramlibacter sp. WS9]|uniref:MATE family efflux transporter n=1 Tax=Ramlibacter sp. WS9 TaxID=1882741 RepID=UPI001142B5CE|nr:MATE family efflux transporter [Ramlibacter sp. WS9]ROZ77011.1 MATE family efflux transporter [Ramlibacter sp. WS9]